MSEEIPIYEPSKEAKNKIAEQFLNDFILIDKMIEDYKKARDEKVKQILEEAPGLTVMITKNNDGTYTRVKLIDHLEEFDEGYYVPTKVSRYQVKVETLKNRPKEMRDQDGKTDNTKD